MYPRETTDGDGFADDGFEVFGRGCGREADALRLLLPLLPFRDDGLEEPPDRFAFEEDGRGLTLGLFTTGRGFAARDAVGREGAVTRGDPPRDADGREGACLGAADLGALERGEGEARFALPPPRF